GNFLPGRDHVTSPFSWTTRRPTFSENARCTYPLGSAFHSASVTVTLPSTSRTITPAPFCPSARWWPARATPVAVGPQDRRSNRVALSLPVQRLVGEERRVHPEDDVLQQ